MVNNIYYLGFVFSRDLFVELRHCLELELILRRKTSLFEISLLSLKVDKDTNVPGRITCGRNPKLASISYNWPLTPYVSIWPDVLTHQEQSQESIIVVEDIIQEILSKFSLDIDDSYFTFFKSIIDKLIENLKAWERMEPNLESKEEADTVIDEIVENVEYGNFSELHCKEILCGILERALQEGSPQIHDYVRVLLSSLVTSVVTRSNETLNTKKPLYKISSSPKVVDDKATRYSPETSCDQLLLGRMKDSKEASHITALVLDELLLNVVANEKNDGGVIEGVLNNIFIESDVVTSTAISSEILDECIEEATDCPEASVEAVSREILETCVEKAVDEKSRESSDVDQSDHVVKHPISLIIKALDNLYN